MERSKRRWGKKKTWSEHVSWKKKLFSFKKIWRRKKDTCHWLMVSTCTQTKEGTHMYTHVHAYTHMHTPNYPDMPLINGNAQSRLANY